MEDLPSAEAEVGPVPAAASGDVTVVDGLAALVNEVYVVAEERLWLTASPGRRVLSSPA
jgi:hypothetical protein